MYIYKLSKQNLDLSKAEVLALAKKKGKLMDNYLLLDELIEFKRLAYTKKVYKLLFSTTKSKVKKDISSFNFNDIYKKNFRVSLVNNKDFEVSELADLIWDKLKNPVSKMKDTETDIEIIFSDKVLCCLLLWESQERFEKRKAHLRQYNHPTSLHPRLARCLVNLANSKNILDPFCGSGGILIEAGLIGIKITGYDIDEKMITRAEKNLESYGIENYELLEFNALKLSRKFEAIVTDMPYGRNSKVQDIKNTYINFLKNASAYVNTMVFVMPNHASKKLIPETHWNIKASFTYYIHKSLSKKIFLLEHV